MVAAHELVRDAVGHHHLRAAELVLGRVDIAPKDFVQGTAACEHHWAVHRLNRPLSKAVQVGTNANGTPSDVGEREDLLVGARGLASNEATTLQVLYADAPSSGGKALAHNRFQCVVWLGADGRVHDLTRHDRTLWQVLIVLLREVEVLVPTARVRQVRPTHLELGHQLLHKAQPRTAVASHVDTRQPALARIHCRLLEEVILRDSEGARLVCHVVRNDHHRAAFGVLWSLKLTAPSKHADLVGVSKCQGVLDDTTILVCNQRRALEHAGRLPAASFPPLFCEGKLQHTEEFGGIGGASVACRGAPGVKGRVRGALQSALVTAVAQLDPFRRSATGGVHLL
mmetsp:Transcript_58695/g.150934  ORF Transcript_58695/g.150934 Transcript_58695/m.150934 type:complete len:341 (-) Transcript_58695:3625-4647(-)